MYNPLFELEMREPLHNEFHKQFTFEGRIDVCQLACELAHLALVEEMIFE
jgi:hypothetical protein